MSVWLNRASYLLPRNGTKTHTIDPSSTTSLVAGSAFTPTSGNFLVASMVSPSTNPTPSGWTSRVVGPNTGNGTMRVISKTAVGGDTFSITHSATNVPMIVEVFEFLAGATFVASATGIDYDMNSVMPTLTPGTHTLMIATQSNDYPAGYNYTNSTWGQGIGPAPTEMLDVAIDNATGTLTSGVWYSSAYAEDTASTSWAPTNTNDSTRDSRNDVVFSINAQSPTRLPQVGSDNGVWGSILNNYLSVSLTAGGALAANTVSNSNFTDGTITATKLDPTIQTSLTKADGAQQSTSLDTATANLVGTTSLTSTAINKNISTTLNGTTGLYTYTTTPPTSNSAAGIYFQILPSAPTTPSLDAISSINTGSSLTWSHTVGSSATILIVAISYGQYPAGSPTTSCTWNGVAMTSLGKQNSANNAEGFVEMFYLMNPATGTHTIVGSSSITSGVTLLGAAASYSGVQNIGSPVTNYTIETTGFTATVPSAPNHIVVLGAVTGSSFTSISSPGTSHIVINANTGSGAGNLLLAHAASTSTSTSITVSTVSDDSGYIAIDLY